MPSHLANFFSPVFLVEMEVHHVAQAGLKLLTSGDPLASASQSAEITGMSHCARPALLLGTGIHERSRFFIHDQDVPGPTESLVLDPACELDWTRLTTPSISVAEASNQDPAAPLTFLLRRV